MSRSRSFQAKYAGPCAICSGDNQDMIAAIEPNTGEAMLMQDYDDWITPGQEVCFLDDELVHDSCAEELHPRPVNNALFGEPNT